MLCLLASVPLVFLNLELHLSSMRCCIWWETTFKLWLFPKQGKYCLGNKKGISPDNLRSHWGTVEEKHPCFQNNYISDFLWSWEISWKLFWSYLCFSCIQPCTLQCCCSCELQKGEISGFQSFRRGDISIILMEPNSRHERAWWTSLPTQTSHLR